MRPRLVVVLHGYGGAPRGAREWLAPHLAPDVELYAPRAPGSARLARSGLEWFSITNDTEMMNQRALAAAAELAPRIRRRQHRAHADGSNTMIIGFSQGAIVASCLIGRVDSQVVVAVSGRVHVDVPHHPESTVRLLAVTGELDRFATPLAVRRDLSTVRHHGVLTSFAEVQGIGHVMASALARSALELATAGAPAGAH